MIMKNISIENTFLFKSFLNVRKQTLKLVKGLSSEDMVIQTDSFVSPIKWHLAHTTWFFEHFILKNFRKYKIFDKSFDYIFNSYYYSVGKFNPKDMRGYLNRPEIEKIFQYRSYVEKNIFDLLTKLSLTPKKKKTFYYRNQPRTAASRTNFNGYFKYIF